MHLQTCTRCVCIMMYQQKLECGMCWSVRVGVQLNRMAVLTAHQMGSARIGTSRATSVADPQGECWDVEGLYICDASALPTSTGAPASAPMKYHERENRHPLLLSVVQPYELNCARSPGLLVSRRRKLRSCKSLPKTWRACRLLQGSPKI